MTTGEVFRGSTVDFPENMMMCRKYISWMLRMATWLFGAQRRFVIRKLCFRSQYISTPTKKTHPPQIYVWNNSEKPSFWDRNSLSPIYISEMYGWFALCKYLCSWFFLALWSTLYLLAPRYIYPIPTCSTTLLYPSQNVFFFFIVYIFFFVLGGGS